MQAVQRAFVEFKSRFLSYWARFKRLYLRNKAFSIPLSVVLLTNLILLIVIIFVFGPAQPAIRLEATSFKLEALTKDSTGVDPESEYLLTSEKPIDEAQVKAALNIVPEKDYELNKISDTQYKIDFDEALSKDKIYKFEIKAQEGEVEKTLSWAFQIKGSFRILQTLPRNVATHVPVNSGIEVTFSHENFSLEEAKKKFEIRPAVNGRFEKHRRTLIFVPKGLKHNTIYTVKVKKGLGLSRSQDVLSRGKTFQFLTEAKSGSGLTNYFSFSNKTYEFPSSEKPVLEGWGEGILGKVSVYKISEEKFLQSLKETDSVASWAYDYSKRYPTSGLTSLMQFDPVIRETQYAKYIEFPQKIPNGFYLIEIKNEGSSFDQAWLQVTPLSAYSAVSGTKSMFWVNSVATKKPVAGASVELVGGGFKATTNKDGVAQGTSPDKLKKGGFDYFKIKSGSSVLIVRVGTSYAYRPIADQYWHYLYLDRGLYRTSDSISFWGLLRKREGSQPNKVKIEVKQDSYTDYFYNPIVILSKETGLSEFSTFNGSLDFSNLKPGSYSVVLKVGSDIIETKYVEVGIFDKPAYQIKITPSKKAVFGGENVTYKVKTGFFEGTSAPNIKLKVTGVVEKAIKTNSNGETSLKVKTKTPDYSPGYQGIYIVPAESEVGDIYAGSGVQVFGSGIKIKGEGKIEGSKAKIEGTIRKVDLSKVKDAYSEDYLGGSVSTDFEAFIYETTWIKKETGDYYDFIEKKVYKTYEYEKVEDLLDTVEAKSDQNGKFTLEFSADSKKDYEVIIEAKDSKGRAEQTTIYVSRSVNTDSPAHYYLESTKDYSAKYKIGGKVELKFKKGREFIKPKPDLRFLYYQSQNGIRDHSVSSSPTYNFTFAKKHIPNVYVTGVFFNGFTYVVSSTPSLWWGSGTFIDFDQSEKKLKIEVKANKKKYAPGDKAKLEVVVKDKNNKGVQAEVNLNVIDEPLYAVSYESDYLDPLNDIYRTVTGGVFAHYLSHQYPKGIPGGGGGGGGGGRDDFRDKVYFGAVKTDRSGKGQVEFKLPDNLTSWRVSAQAITKDLQVGGGGGNIAVSKGLFVEANVPSEFLLADKPDIKLRAFGSSLKSADSVEFVVKAPSLGWVSEKKISGSAFKPSFVKPPKLKEGGHKLTFTVRAKGLTDTVVKQIQVIKGRTRVGKIKEYSLTSDLKLKGSADQNTLTFINEVQGVTYPILKKQLWSFSDRLETKLAQKIAAKLLKEHFNEDYYVEPINFVRYQTPQGGLAIFPYADNDLKLSAKVASYNANNFDKDGLRSYFLSVLDSKRESRGRALIALWGLASLGDPVLVQLDNITQKAKLSLSEQLFVSLAYLELGNKEKARSMFDTILENSSEKKTPYIYIKNKNREKLLELTSLAAMVGSQLQDKRTTAIMRFIADETPKETLIDLERVLASVDYLGGFVPSKANFTLGLDGKEETVKLAGEPYTISVDSKQLKEMFFKNVEGKVLVSVAYETPLKKGEVPRDKNLGIKRQYFENNNLTTTFSEGSLVKIAINYEIAGPIRAGCHQVRDHLPSGLRAVTNPYIYVSEKDIWYVYQNTGQTISFCVREGGTKPIKYFARVVSKGQYRAEPAIIQHHKAKEVLNFTNSQTVNIR